VTIAATLVGIVGAAFFASGRRSDAILGSLLFIASAVIDCIDGDLARAVFKESRIGRWLDLWADQVVHVAVFAGIGAGVAASGSDAPALLLSASAIAGAAISCAVVVRGLLHPERRQNARVARLIDRLTNRDFAYLILILALVGRLDVFLWLAAIGSHVFWLVALSLQRMERPVRASGVGPPG
jgi:phosphatidylglycerophosphate synthase